MAVRGKKPASVIEKVIYWESLNSTFTRKSCASVTCYILVSIISFPSWTFYPSNFQKYSIMIFLVSLNHFENNRNDSRFLIFKLIIKKMFVDTNQIFAISCFVYIYIGRTLHKYKYPLYLNIEYTHVFTANCSVQSLLFAFIMINKACDAVKLILSRYVSIISNKGNF